jgi:hypothetical protein
VKRLVLVTLALVGCSDDIDEQWVLDHDRIIAVRSTPAGIESGETAVLDMLVGYADRTKLPEVRKPDAAQVVSPESLASAVSFDGTNWIVTAPDEAALDAARAELKLDAGAPVPLSVGVAAGWPTPVMSVEGNGFGALKTVWLGEERENPELMGITIDGVEAPPEGTPIVISAAKDAKTRLAVDADDGEGIVNWLISCCSMHDFDLNKAYITVDKDDEREGQLALVVHTPDGGVVWRIWPISAE